MRKFIITSLLLYISIITPNNLLGQSFDVSKFPILEIKVHERNPDTLTTEKFSFYENVDGKEIKIDSFSVSTYEDSLNIASKNKTILILAEVLLHSSRIEQNFTFRDALLQSLDEFVKDGDKIKISAFSLKDGETKILKDVSKGFTDDVEDLKTSIENFYIEDNDYTNKPVSDIFGSVIEGIELLEEVNEDFPKSILILSDERNNSLIANQEKVAIESALEKNVAIYSLKYNRVGYQQYTDAKTLSKKTFGLQKSLGISSGNFEGINSKKSEEAKEFIVSSLNESTKRAKGLDYKVNLKLNNNLRDGKEYIISYRIGEDKKEVLYKAPGNWLYAQFQKDPLIASILSALSFILFVLIIYLIWRKYKTQLELREERRRQQRERELQQEDKINEQNEELLKIKSEEENRKRQQEKKENQRLNEELIREMLKKGSFPILKFTHNDISKQFEVNKPILKVGREKETNDICISNNNISRNHFTINFKGGKYTIVDNNSTNGILVNGRKLKETVLNNADIINIADTTFIFYE